MGHRLTIAGALLALGALSGCAQQPVPHEFRGPPEVSAEQRWENDLVREHYYAKIMRRAPDVNLEPDLAATRDVFARTAVPDRVTYPERPMIPSALIRSERELSLGQLLDLMGKTTNYHVAFHDDVDRSQRISLNQQANRLDVLVAYLESVTGASIHLYPESRLILVLPTQY